MEPSKKELARLNLLFETVQSDIASFQDSYRERSGRYWQGPMIPRSIPSISSPVAPEKRTRATDAEVDWSDTPLKVPNSTDAAFSVDVYMRASGEQGYVLRMRCKAGDTIMMRSFDFGTEGMTDDWHVVTPVI